MIVKRKSNGWWVVGWWDGGLVNGCVWVCEEGCVDERGVIDSGGDRKYYLVVLLNCWKEKIIVQ